MLAILKLIMLKGVCFVMGIVRWIVKLRNIGSMGIDLAIDRLVKKTGKCHTVVCGHIHTPSFKLIDGVYYLNCGDWIENCTHVVLTNNSLELCYQNN
jgi:hypothetical protein